ncbi:hypothetical protein NSQ59_27545 [Margalitia sp. FSL K6-0131]|uniref:hypothetical protein n=1 Tax=Margalitia sp. FSL K6-0131 TaxID=2954604 RepID=UPI0030F4D646
MVQPLNRQKRDSETKNPFLEIEKKEVVEAEPLKTMKVPESTHKKLLALSKLKNNKLYEMVDQLAESYIDNLTEEEKAIFNFMLSKD